MQYTEEQLRVIEARDTNLLVSAAAGSGKTAVLVERIIRRVLDVSHPVDIDRLLIVTFTSAAAAEMRARIGQAITDALEKDPLNEHLQRQSTLIHNAQIMTIDSFCLFVIRNNFNDIGLDPNFRVADEGEIRLLEEDVMQSLLEDCFATGEEAFINCVEAYSTNGREQNLEKLLMDLYHYSLSYPAPEKWLEARKNDYQMDSVEAMEQSGTARLAVELADRTIDACQKLTQEAIRLCEQPDGPYMYGAALESDLEQLEKLKKAEGYEQYYEQLSGIKFATLSSKKDPSVNSDTRQLVKDIRDRMKKELQELSKRYFPIPAKEVVRQAALCAPMVQELTQLAIEFKKRMDEKKRAAGILDFSDMEHLALSILLRMTISENGEVMWEPTPTALDYRAHYEEIMTDEYQDSNLVQECLLSSIARGNNRFMVGDVKQSIYKFRLARPEIFMEKMKSDPVISLHKNFRSRREVIDSINDVFAKVMDASVGGIDYDSSQALYPGAAYEEAGEGDPYRTELLLIEEQEEFEKKELEAFAIAARIRELVGHFPVTDKETRKLRPAEYKDIVILLRSASGYDEVLREVLQQEGIPAYIASKTGYFMTSEIRVLLQVLRVWDNPLQDIPLYGVLTSMFGGFSEEELASIRAETTKSQTRRHTALYHSLIQFVGTEPEETALLELKAKVEQFLDWLSKWRKKTIYLPIHELLEELLAQSHYVQYVTALPAGEKRRANVLLLLEKAKTFEQTSFYGLFHFIRYLEKIEKYEIDYGEADTLDENADLVRIMTIHKSKGLEFPICIVAGLSRRFNTRDTSGMLLMDLDMGIGTDAVDLSRRTYAKTLRKTIMASKMQMDSLGEELRVLYVAMTRAKEKLIMTASVENGEKGQKRLQNAKQAATGTNERLGFLTLLRAGCFLDYLLAAVGGEASPNISIRQITADELKMVRLRQKIDLVEKRSEVKALAEGLAALSEQEKEAVQSIQKRFCYEYPSRNLEKLSVKTSVSELKMAAMFETEEASARLFEEREVIPYIPSFMRRQEKISGTTRGSAFHKALELLPLEQLVAPDDPAENGNTGGVLSHEELCHRVVEELDRLVEQKLLTREYREAVNPGKLATFLQSSLAKRMARAMRCGKLYREQPFVLGIGADRLGKDFPADEMVLVQGIIDVCFEENGKMILADYKTDVVDTLEQLASRYRTQLSYYAEALERTRGLPVTEQIIYSFHFEKEFCVEE